MKNFLIISILTLSICVLGCKKEYVHYQCFNKTNVCPICKSDAYYVFEESYEDCIPMVYDKVYPKFMLRTCKECSYRWREEVCNNK